MRNTISAPALFDQGAGVFDPRPVPAEVLTALRAAGHDDNPRVSVEALYAFGALSDNAYGPSRRALLSASVTELVAALAIGARGGAGRGDPGHREALLVANGRRVGRRACRRRGGHRAERPASRRSVLLRWTRSAGCATTAACRRSPTPISILGVGRLPPPRSARSRALAHPSSLPLFSTALASRDAPLRVAAIEGLARAGATDQLQAINAVIVNEKNADVLLAGHFASVLLADGTVDDLVASPRARQAARRGR